ncbi:hypothetical protein F383_24181 [Gossypium arboreum]|uniref:Uncharacterized protein n=1 Tax=Gossypium arboreum TaxID=29729 RepID=A0A0B0NYG0_GOSAR|nr:hypothetical protein F383_24181 [Gossypium arboreum]
MEMFELISSPRLMLYCLRKTNLMIECM